ncbi:MAG: DUF480 domain-containing protein [Gemmataceae bacterium]
MPNREPLSTLERRVLGVLIEKQKTSKTADAYPMTLNSLTTGCNQKSNRDPVLELSDDDVEETLTALQKKNLVMKMTGGRADRYRHLLYEAWSASKIEMAILAELLLRGPQSVGDLRGRASRMEEITSLDLLQGYLKDLVERKLVVFLTDPDRRGAMVTHGFHVSEEMPAIQAFVAGFHSPIATPSVHAPMASAPPASPALAAEVQQLREEIAELRAQFQDLRKQLGLS